LLRGLEEMEEQFLHLLRNFKLYSLSSPMMSGKKWQIYLQAFPAPIQLRRLELETKLRATSSKMLATTGTAESLTFTRALVAKLTGRSERDTRAVE
jgi:hypothetical protein